MNEYKVGDIEIATVTCVRFYGANLLFNDGRKGFLHISEIANEYIHNIKKRLLIGKTYHVKIISVDADGFLKVSIRQITNDDMKKFRLEWQSRNPVPEEEIDFTSLKQHLDKWQKEYVNKEENSDDKIEPESPEQTN